MLAFLRQQLRHIVEASKWALGLPGDYFWSTEEALLTVVLRDALTRSANAGGLFAIGELQRRYRVGVDWGLINASAQEWAGDNAASLAKGMTETTLAQVRQAIAAWIESGEPLSRLARRLQGQLGIARRAQLIAQTESTRAFVEGNRLAWAESGVVDREQWNTANDERVCPICGPLHGKQNQRVGGEFVGGYRPPAHPACRCWTSPVVEGT